MAELENPARVTLIVNFCSGYCGSEYMYLAATPIGTFVPLVVATELAESYSYFASSVLNNLLRPTSIGLGTPYATAIRL